MYNLSNIIFNGDLNPECFKESTSHSFSLEHSIGHQNPELAELITEVLGGDASWIEDPSKLVQLKQAAFDDKIV